MSKLDIIIPVYNEDENIIRLLKALENEILCNFRILICYDSDSDKTLKQIKNNKVINKESHLSEIGSFVKIDPTRINDNVSDELSEILSKNPVGQVIGYKITDGTDIGLIIKLNNGSSAWFFNHELNQIDSSLISKTFPSKSITKNNKAIILRETFNKLVYKVYVLSKDKKKYYYIWQIEKVEREGILKNCWMTSAVSEPIYLGEVI